VASVINDPAIAGMLPAKIFDTIGLGTPMLFIGPDGSDLDEIAETTQLARRFTADNIDGISRFIEEAMNGSVPKARRQEVYAWSDLARKFDCLLRPVAAKSAVAG
jgi:hypothetical protein